MMTSVAARRAVIIELRSKAFFRNKAPHQPTGKRS